MQRTRAQMIADGQRAVLLAREVGVAVPTLWLEALSDLIDQEVDSWPWMLREWRRASIPDWRRILAESTEMGHEGRAARAVWMLEEVLLDPDRLLRAGKLQV